MMDEQKGWNGRCTVLLRSLELRSAPAMGAVKRTAKGILVKNIFFAAAVLSAVALSGLTVVAQFASAQTTDCNKNGVEDSSEFDPQLIIDPEHQRIETIYVNDKDQDGVLDACETPATCSGQCVTDISYPDREAFDEDNDGVSNCQEIRDGTDACDRGSFISRLPQTACGGVNGFFKQVNIATVINRRATAIPFHVEYRDLTGVVQGAVDFTLDSGIKRDVIINDLGLVPDTYGTVCVTDRDATARGEWTGGITIYKRRETASNGFSGSETFDFALNYPFSDSQQGKITIPINTNTIGTDGRGTVANWIRISDATPGDGIGLRGTVRYFNAGGVQTRADRVDLADGGRFDYAAHDAIGAGAVGLAQFEPDDLTSKFYVEITRYFYEGVGAQSDKFYTAFPLQVRALTGAPVTGKATSRPNEISIVEMVNGTASAVNAGLKVFTVDGGQILNQTIGIPAMGTIHRVLTNEVGAPGVLGAAEVTAPVESLATTSVVYGFGTAGELQYAYAPPFAESAGAVQVSEFNSFIGHKNTLEVYNAADVPITANVQVVTYDNRTFNLDPLHFAPRATIKGLLPVPDDSYGSIIVNAQSNIGLVVRNDVTRDGEYVMPFGAR